MTNFTCNWQIQKNQTNKSICLLQRNKVCHFLRWLAVPGSEYQEDSERMLLTGVRGLGSLGKKQRKERTSLLVSPIVFYLVMLSTLSVFRCLTKLTDMHIGRMPPLKAGQNFTIANVKWTCNRPLNIHRWRPEGAVYNPQSCVSNKSVTMCGLLLAIVSVFPHKLKQHPRLTASK